MNSIINTLRDIPCIYLLERACSKAFGRAWSLWSGPEEPPAIAQHSPKPNPLHQVFGEPGKTVWIRVILEMAQKQKEEEKLPPFKASTLVKRSQPIPISRSPEQEKLHKREQKIEALSKKLESYLEKTNLAPHDYQAAEDLLIRIELKNIKLDSPQIDKEIKKYRLILKSYQKINIK